MTMPTTTSRRHPLASLTESEIKYAIASFRQYQGLSKQPAPAQGLVFFDVSLLEDFTTAQKNGALLHLLSSSVFRTTGGFADVPRRANVLVSFNNKPATEAIPAFDEVVAPIAEQVMGTLGGK